MPDPSQWRPQSTINNQGRGAALTPDDPRGCWTSSRGTPRKPIHYAEMIAEEGPEHPKARALPASLPAMKPAREHHTQWYTGRWTCTTCSNFSPRADAHAQYEIRVYADVICNIVADWSPPLTCLCKIYRLAGRCCPPRDWPACSVHAKGREVTQEDLWHEARAKWREVSGRWRNLSASNPL